MYGECFAASSRPVLGNYGHIELPKRFTFTFVALQCSASAGGNTRSSEQGAQCMITMQVHNAYTVRMHHACTPVTTPCMTAVHANHACARCMHTMHA
eukprot:364255-Chlamydomonas_euryale.AAC.6